MTDKFDVPDETVRPRKIRRRRIQPFVVQYLASRQKRAAAGCQRSVRRRGDQRQRQSLAAVRMRVGEKCRQVVVDAVFEA